MNPGNRRIPPTNGADGRTREVYFLVPPEREIYEVLYSERCGTKGNPSEFVVKDPTPIALYCTSRTYRWQKVLKLYETVIILATYGQNLYKVWEYCKLCVLTRGTRYNHQKNLRLLWAKCTLELIYMYLLGTLLKTKRFNK